MDSSKDERIAARRLRIQQKLAMRQGAGAAGSAGAAMIIHEKADVRIGETDRVGSAFFSLITLFWPLLRQGSDCGKQAQAAAAIG
jgi:hypothetical protein